MLKTLIKKQFLSLLGGFGFKGKDAKKGVGGYVLILAVISVAGGIMFFSYSRMLAEPLIAADLGWLFFVYAGLMCVVLSVIIGIFMSQSCLYEAKDNDLLLSLPIPPKYILFVRMVPMYAQSLLFEAIVLVPSCISWCMYGAVTAAQVVIWVLMLFIQPFLSLFITCLVGLLLALITSRLRDKTLVTVILSIVFIVGYIIIYTQIMKYIGALISNSSAIGGGIKNGFYPLYKFGTAMTGDFVGFLITLCIIGVLFGGLYFALSKTYIKLVTDRRGSKKAKYNGRVERQCSVTGALLKKEVRRFFSSGVYFLNSGLGVILLVIAMFFVIIQGNSLLETISQMPDLYAALPMLLILGVCFISAMDGVSAPSISLEGKSLWILNSSPIDVWKVLKAKLIFHYLVTAPAATVCMAVFAIMVQPSWAMIVFMLISPSIAVSLFGILGLIINLKMPNLNWENETVVIKQSMSVLLTMLISWGVFGVFAGLYFAARLVMTDEIYVLVCMCLLVAASAGLLVFLKKKGTKTFAELQ